MAEGYTRDNMSENDHEQRGATYRSNVSLNDEERAALTQRKLMLERELSSLSVILQKSKVSVSVPTPSIKRDVDPRATRSIENQPSFHGFSHCSTPYFRRTAAKDDTHIQIPTPTHDRVRQHRATRTQRMSKMDLMTQHPKQPQHDVIDTESPISNSLSSSNRLMGLRTIDEWVDDVCDYNNRQSARSVSTKFREITLNHQKRDNVGGSTNVELLNSSTIIPRLREQGIDHWDQHGMETGYMSMEPQVFDTRSTASQHRSQWGSTKVELLNTLRYVGEQPSVNTRMEQSDQRQHLVEDQSYNIPRRANIDRNLIDHRRDEHLHTQFERNCAQVTYSRPQIHCDRGSTNVELLNTSPHCEGCGDKYGHTNEQMHPRQVLSELPGQNFGQREDARSSRPFGYDQKNVPHISQKTTRDNQQKDRMSQHDIVNNDQQNDLNKPLPTQVAKAQIGTNDDVMKTLVSRQILGKDIPEYSGEVSKWISFIDHYNDTTQDCKFTDRENIMRLKKCLKGKAYTCVQSLLLSSTDPKKIIDMLRRRFGRPDDIVKAEIQKVKAIPSPKEDDPQSIIEFATAVQNLVFTLETLKKPNHLMNPELLDDLQYKLPPTLNLLWSEYIVDRKEDLTLKVLSDWLDRRAEAASRRTTMKVYDVEPTQKPKFKARVNTVNASSDTTITNLCYSCHGNCKTLEDCEAFAKLDVHKRWDLAKKNKLCFFCLSTSHEYKDCTKKGECPIEGCKRFHHKLLHSNPKKVGIIKANVKSHVTKLRIVPVILYGKSTEIKTFALLDPGSTSTLMSQHLSNLLQLDGPISPLLLEWMNGEMAVENDSKIVDTRIQGTHDGAKIYDLFNVRTVKNLPLHKQTIDKSALVKQWPYLRTVDFEGYENAQPQLLIGENNGLLTATRQLVHDTWNSPIASKTWLGWVISGNEGKTTDTSLVKIFITYDVETDSLHDLVQSSFNLEEDGVSQQQLSRSKEDERALQLLEKYTIFNENRWETDLLWRNEQAILPESRKNALLGSKISRTILDEHNVEFYKLVLWTDNIAVWYWIQSETKRYKQFVANRLSEILALTQPRNWKWVPTVLNSADDATRSTKIPDFNQHSRWYKGPDFLYENEVNWPEQPGTRLQLSNELVEVLEYSNFVVEKPNFQLPDATRFSKWLRLLRATSWILRFVNNCKRMAKRIITATFPGIDGEIRVVDVTTHTGTYRRPMNKICLFESTIAPVPGEDV